jgi:HSP20 family protein
MPPVIRKTESSVSLKERRREVLQAVGWQMQVRSTVWSPPTDLYETENAYVVRVEVAGMREQDFEVMLDNNYLVISGSRPDLPERRAYHQMEIRFGRFSAVAGIPDPVDVDTATAVYEDGFLLVSLPKLKPTPPHSES